MPEAKSTASMILAYKKEGGKTIKCRDHNKPPKIDKKVGLSHR